MRPTGRDFSSWLSLLLSLRESCVSKRSLHTTSAVSWSTTPQVNPTAEVLLEAMVAGSQTWSRYSASEEGPGQSLWPVELESSSGIHT